MTFDLPSIIGADVALRPISGELHGPCPFCGGDENSDRFWINKKRDHWRCRQCEKNGDAIAYLVETGRMTAKDAYKARRGDSDLDIDFAPRRVAIVQEPAAPPPVEPPGTQWQTTARQFVTRCQAVLWSDAGKRAQAWLNKRGLTDQTIKAAGLGYNPAALYNAREEWGLSPESNERGSPRRIWLPRGIVIPWLAGGDIWRVNIRRPDGQPKYISPAGWKNGLYNADALNDTRPALMVEGEFDALLLQQFQDAVTPVATGTNTGSRRQRWIDRLNRCPEVLATFDPDKAGRQARKYWLGKLNNAREWLPVGGDITEMWHAGIDLENWAKRGLLEAIKPEPVPASPPKKSYSEGGWWRKLTPCDPPPPLAVGATMREVWAQLYTAMIDYLETPAPDSVLLVRAMPGLGKTTTAIKVILRQLKTSAGLIGFFAPRHDLYDEVLAAIDREVATSEADPAAILYAQHWLPRCDARARKDATWPVTCRQYDAITEWLRRGYESIDFCRGVCGYDVMRECNYMRQSRGDIASGVGLVDEMSIRPRLIFGQHQHLQGHALLDRMKAVFIDENCVNSFLSPVTIRSKQIVSPLLPNDSPLKGLLHELQGISSEKAPVSGPELLTRLGGADRVLDILDAYDLLTELNATAAIHDAAAVAHYPRLYLFEFVQLLKREAAEAAQGRNYIHRVFVGNGKIKLLSRKAVSDKLPQHVILMDGTADKRIISEIFNRPVTVVDIQQPLQSEVIQIYDRGNGASTLYERDAETQTVSLKRGGEQLKELVKEILEAGHYTRPGIISFLAIEDELGHVIETPDILTRHFGAASGTNAFSECDCLIVAGTYQPPLTATLQNAAMIYYDRMAPFQADWTPGEGYVPPEVITTPAAPYQRYAGYIADDGDGRCYPIGGYWGDADLQAVVGQSRLAELTQAAFRLRPHKNPGKLFLIFNLPLPLVPPDKLITRREAIARKAPLGKNRKKWDIFEKYVRNSLTSRVYQAKIVAETGLYASTVSEYMEEWLRMHSPSWQVGEEKRRKYLHRQ